jgi:hypothetical protein
MTRRSHILSEKHDRELKMADLQYFDVEVDWLSGVSIIPLPDRVMTSARDEGEIDLLIAAMKRDLDLVGELAKESIKKLRTEPR